MCSVYLEQVWLSARPARFQFSVLTQLTIDRIPALFNQCTTYRGPLSAAVYLAIVEEDIVRGKIKGADDSRVQGLSDGGRRQVDDAVKALQAMHEQ